MVQVASSRREPLLSDREDEKDLRTHVKEGPEGQEVAEVEDIEERGIEMPDDNTDATPWNEA